MPVLHPQRATFATLAALAALAAVVASPPTQAFAQRAPAPPPPQVEQPNAARPYSFVYFRVNEFGERIPGDEVSAVTREVERLRDTGPSKDVFAVVFIHGWQHDASPDDEHVKQFRALLDSLAGRRARFGTHVLGVYVGWPAKSGWGPASFWSKRALADKVVRSLEVTKLLEHVNAAVKGPSGTRDSRLVYIGHSFGGRILFSAAAQAITANIVRQGQRRPGDPRCQGENTVCRPVEGYGDLLILVNPALEARMYSTFSQYSPHGWHDARLADNPGEHWGSLQPPILLAIGADNDAATQTWWPRSLGLQDDSLERVTLTNHVRYLTHHLAVDGALACSGSEPCGCAAGAVSGPSGDRTRKQAESVYRRSAASERFGCAKLVPLAPQAGSNSPFIVARADRRLIDDHGGIWGGAFRQFILEYIDAANALPRPHYDRPPSSR